MAAFYRQRWFPYAAGGGLLAAFLGWRYWQRKKAEEAAAAEGTQITEGPEGVYVAISPSQAADYGEFGAIGSLEPLMDRDRVEGPGAEGGYTPTKPPMAVEIPGIIRPPEYATSPVERVREALQPLWERTAPQPVAPATQEQIQQQPGFEYTVIGQDGKTYGYTPQGQVWVKEGATWHYLRTVPQE
jgi:hypothetical protein